MSSTITKPEPPVILTNQANLQKLTHPQIREMFPGRFSRQFLHRYCSEWHPRGSKPHPLFGRWIKCGLTQGSFQHRAEEWYSAKDLHELAEKIDEAAVVAPTGTMTAFKIAQLAGLPPTVIYMWEKDCTYLPEYGGKLSPLSRDLEMRRDGFVRSVKLYDEVQGMTAIANFKSAKTGRFQLRDPQENMVEYLSWFLAVRRAGKRDEPLKPRRLKELADLGVVHRQRSPFPGYKSKYSENPWVFHSGHLDAYRNGDHSKKFNPQTGKPFTKEETAERERVRKQGTDQPHWFDGMDWYEMPCAKEISKCSKSCITNWTPDPRGKVHKPCPHPLPHGLRCIRRSLEDRQPPLRRLWLGDDLRAIRKARGLSDLPRPEPATVAANAEVALPVPRGHVKVRILKKMWANKAVSEDTLAKTKTIARWCEGFQGNPENYKQPLAALVKSGYLKSVSGEFGGYFLTPRGAKTAETLEE